MTTNPRWMHLDGEWEKPAPVVGVSASYGFKC
jgi:hypothetical protein